MNRQHHIARQRVVNYFRHLVPFLTNRVERLSNAEFTDWDNIRNQWMNSHYLGRLNERDSSSACGWIYCACSIYDLRRLDDFSIRDTSGLGMDIFARGKQAETVMRNFWEYNYAKFSKLFPYYEVDLDLNQGV